MDAHRKFICGFHCNETEKESSFYAIVGVSDEQFASQDKRPIEIQNTFYYVSIEIGRASCRERV